MQNNRQPDPHAVNIARAVQEASDGTVILFGSRARGDYTRDSDADILVIGHTKGSPLAAARRYMTAHPPELEVQIFEMTRPEFGRKRLATQSLAGHAARHGVWMSSERNDYTHHYEDEYPVHWPATRNCLENGWENLREMQEKIEANSWNQKAIGYSAQQAVENGLKSLLSIHQDPAEFRHDLRAIWNHYLHHHHNPRDPGAHTVQEAVEDLMDHTAYDSPRDPGQKECWLTDYARQYRYRQDYRRMAEYELQELKLTVEDAFFAIMDHVNAVSGTSETDLFPDGKPWESSP